MTDRYVGPGGDDGNSGLTWALRKETLNGVEDTPVVAGDTVYVGPGTYRETLVCDVDGSSGNVITYTGDVTGENTDGVGGVVRITGLTTEDSYPPTRGSGITNVLKDYRKFENFWIGELSSGVGIQVSGGGSFSNFFVERVYFAPSAASGSNRGVDIAVSTVSDIEVKNCFFGAMSQSAFDFDGFGSCSPSYLENCLLFIASPTNSGVEIWNTYDFIVRACTIMLGSRGLNGFNLNPDQTYIYDNLFQNANSSIYDTGDDVTDDYNMTSWSGFSDMDGANHLNAIVPLRSPLLSAGYKLPWDVHEPTGYNNNIYKSDYSSLTKDLYGLSRPGGDKFSRGAIQYKGVERETTEYLVSPSSMRMNDASKHIVSIPIDGTKKIRVSVWVKRETNYAGTNPQMILSFPTQAATTVTDTGSTGTYNELSAEVTPTASDRWLQIQLVSNNTASSGSYKVYFDDMKIKTATKTVPTMKWATNDIPLFCFSLENVVDPWITPSIPVPTFQGDIRSHYPMPSARPLG